MFPIANKQPVKKLTIRSLKANRSRNRYVVLAIVMTAWLLTSVFSVGMSYMKSFQMQDLKILGTKADAAIGQPTKQQLEALSGLPYISKIGLDQQVGRLVTAEENNRSASLHLYDQTEWDSMKAPLLGGRAGDYPLQRNEIIAPDWLLEEMGIEEPKAGMEISLSYRVTGKEDGAVHKESFKLSGWYTDYTGLFSDNAGKILVSKAFAEQVGADLTASRTASVLFKNGTDKEEGVSRLNADLKLERGQEAYANSRGTGDGEDSISTYAGVAGIALIVMLSGYLLIYNVLYISISTDTKFYGLLKTIGMTPKQVKKLVRGQALRLMRIGIPAGLLLGAITSYAAVPFALSMFNLNTEVEISIHPIIYIGAAVFAWMTTMAGSRKPARIAGKISPIEAAKYVRASAKRSRNGFNLHRMALRNLFRDKKRAVTVFLSLTLGLTTFLTINTLILSMNTDNFIDEYVANDFELINRSAESYNGGERQLFTDDFRSAVKELEGIEEVRTTYMSAATVEYSPDVFGKHVDEFTSRYGAERPSDELLSQQKQLFWSRLVGVNRNDIEELNKRLSRKIDVNRFERGEIALLDTSQESILLGDVFNLTLPGDSAKHSFEIGGIADQPFKLPFSGMAPNVYVSEKAMKQLIADPIVYKMNMSANEKQHPAIQQKLETMTAGMRDAAIESKQQWSERMKSAKLTFYVLGGAVTLILAFIGIMNFVSTMFTSVVIRRNEFAIMESIGMTKRQLRKLLVLEGAAYAVISSALVATLGSLVSYGAYKLFSKEATYAVFKFPIVPLSILLLIVFGVCLSVPVAAFNQTRKGSIVDRLKEAG